MSAIIPAVLCASREELRRQLARLRGTPFIQLDVVDGEFAAPPSWPYNERSDIPETLPELAEYRFEADLMVKEPEHAVGAWLRAGASRITLHLESMREPMKTLARIKNRYGHENRGAKSFELGLAINTRTELATLEEHLAHVDYVQLMGIDSIGKQGQPFDPCVIERVRALRAAHPALVIQVDGGISQKTAPALVSAGADRLIIGSAITLASDPAEAFTRFSALFSAPHSAWHQHSLSRSESGYTAAMPLTDTDINALAEKANEIRQTVVEMLVAAGSGHTAGPLGMADIFAALYFHILRHDPKNPDWPERDRLILSNGHICPVRYAAMAHAGYFPLEECLTLRKFGSRLQGHPERTRLPGLETTSGPLGSGLAQAAGVAYALRMDMDERRDVARPDVSGRATSRRGLRVYCVVSDGEQDEGNTWEAAMFAGKYKLHNLTAIMDRNNIQIDGMTEDVMPLEPLADKYRAFGWHVLEANGHDIAGFVGAVEEAKAIYEKPTIIIAHTIPGKGVAEIEFDYRWHGKPPTKEEGARFLKELRTLGGKISHDYA